MGRLSARFAPISQGALANHSTVWHVLNTRRIAQEHTSHGYEK